MAVGVGSTTGVALAFAVGVESTTGGSFAFGRIHVGCFVRAKRSISRGGHCYWPNPGTLGTKGLGALVAIIKDKIVHRIQKGEEWGVPRHFTRARHGTSPPDARTERHSAARTVLIGPLSTS